MVQHTFLGRSMQLFKIFLVLRKILAFVKIFHEKYIETGSIFAAGGNKNLMLTSRTLNSMLRKKSALKCPKFLQKIRFIKM